MSSALRRMNKFFFFYTLFIFKFSGYQVMRLTMVAPSFNDFVVKESHVKTL